MKRSLVLPLLVVIASAGLSRSQENGVGPGPQWRRYTVKREEFSVTLPALPWMTRGNVLRKVDGKSLLERQLKLYFDGVYYSIEAFENVEPRQSLEQFIDEVGLSSDYDPATKRRLSIDGFAGIEYLASNDISSGMVQFLATEQHLYRFVASAPSARAAAVKEFFSSIKLGKNPEGIEVSEPPATQVQSYTAETIYVEVDVKVRIQTKPQPSYTEDALRHQISGTVILKAIFTKTGHVENIRVVSGLPYGLTEEAVAAARKIKFTPAMKDGKPVSMWMQLEYNFYF
ncbi:MAG TPA: energy transducer TonB [Pyrinomonadaceae bacterium]